MATRWCQQPAGSLGQARLSIAFLLGLLIPQGLEPSALDLPSLGLALGYLQILQPPFHFLRILVKLSEQGLFPL